jgi:nucleotide-binding universal stress UspA family protein
MYQRILVAVDGSRVSDQALDEALRLAKDQSAELRIVHVVDTVTLSVDTEFADIAEYQQKLHSAGQKVLKKAEEAVKRAGGKAETALLELQILGHRTASAIIDEAQRWPADLIVVGTHGRRGISHLFVGSVAEGVVRLASRPVLLVHGK